MLYKILFKIAYTYNLLIYEIKNHKSLRAKIIILTNNQKAKLFFIKYR